MYWVFDVEKFSMKSNGDNVNGGAALHKCWDDSKIPSKTYTKHTTFKTWISKTLLHITFILVKKHFRIICF
jgi:hypothetical protein